MEEILDFVGQAKKHIARAAGAMFGGRFQQGFNFMIGQARNDGRRHNGDGHAGIGKCADRLQAARRRCCARLHLAGEGPVECGDRNTNPCKAHLSHRANDINVAFDQGRLGEEADRVIVRREDLEQFACDARVAIGRLVGIGVHTQRDGAGQVAGT